MSDRNQDAQQRGQRARRRERETCTHPNTTTGGPSFSPGSRQCTWCLAIFPPPPTAVDTETLLDIPGTEVRLSFQILVF